MESTHNGEVTGQFSGKFTNINQMSGTWRSADKKKQFPFELKESYSRDCTQFTTYELIDSCPLFDDADSPKIEIFLFYIYPIKYRNQNILTQLQQYILPESFGNPQKKLESMRDSYLTVYQEENRDIYNPDSLWMFMWQHSYGTSLILNDKNMFTCRFYFYDYMGGAHGLSGDGFVTIDMSTGKKLKPEDIFMTDYEEQLGKIMDKKLRAQEEIPPEAALQDHEFFVDEILPNDNFYVALDGIGFYFNIYEIRPYAFGATDIFLSFKEIKHLIKADSPVRRLFE